MIRAVLDTNVLVSGLLSPGGACSYVLRLAGYDVFEICLDSRILREYEAVLDRFRGEIDLEEAASILDFMREGCEDYSELPRLAALPHRKDTLFLEVAAAADAVLVTGNLKHFPPKSRSGVTVVSPAQFLDLLRHA